MFPSNCDSDIGLTERCPLCDQFHLRLGYCQALNPVNTSVNTEAVVNSPVNRVVSSADERRKAYRREWMRKRRGSPHSSG